MADPCSCHLGSVCGPACADGEHHDGCAHAGEMTVAEALELAEARVGGAEMPPKHRAMLSVLAAEVRRQQAENAMLKASWRAADDRAQMRQEEADRSQADVERLTADLRVAEDGRVQHQHTLKAIALAVGAEHFDDILPAVQAAVEAAYREGYDDGFSDGHRDRDNPNKAWAASKARRELGQ